MKELWQNERSRAGISLALWGVFIIVILIVAISTSRNGTKISKPAVKEEVIENPFESLVGTSNNFKMVARSLDDSVKRIYDVTIKQSEIYEGYVEDESGINRFRCNSKCYMVFSDYEEETPIYNEELINNIDLLKKTNVNVSKMVFQDKDSDSEYNSYMNYEDEKSMMFMVDGNNRVVKIMIEDKDKEYIFSLDEDTF